MALTSVHSTAACAVLTMTLVAASVTPDAGAQRSSPAEGPWSGQAQCVVVGKWTDYLDEQTHTWKLTGEAPTSSSRGSSQVYYSWPATWSVQGSGRKTWPSREPAATGREQTERWTIAHEMKMALRFTEVGAGTDRLRIGTEGQRGAPAGALRVTEVSGRTREYSVQQWAFPAIEDSAGKTTISGTSTKTYPEGFGVGLGQPPKALTTATCAWHFTRAGVERSSAIRPPAPSGSQAATGTIAIPSVMTPATAVVPGNGIGQPTPVSTPPPSTTALPSGRDANVPIGTPAAPERPTRPPVPTVESEPANPGVAGTTTAIEMPLTGGAGGLTLACPRVPPPPFSATPGGVTFTLNRPAGTTGYRISRRDLGDLTATPITASSFTHVAPLGYWTTYEYMFHGVLADGSCSSATVMVTPPRPLVPQVTATVTLGSAQSNRVTLSWAGQSDRPTSYAILGAGLPEAGGDVPASTGSARHSFEIVNLAPGAHRWEVIALWKTPTGNMSDMGARVTVTIPSMTVSPSLARTIDLPGFTASGGWMNVGPRTIELTGFTGVGTTDVGPRTITLGGWTANGPFAPIQGVVK